MEHTLEMILHELEKMDDHFPLDLYSFPTAAEIRLYGLIHGQVNTYIQLFLTEDDLETPYSCTRPHEGQSGPPQDTTSALMNTQYSCKRHHKGEAGLPQGGEASASPSQRDTVSLPRVVCYDSVCETFEKTFSNYIDINDLMDRCRSLLPYSQHISALNFSMGAVGLADFGSKGCIGNKETPPGLSVWPGPKLEPQAHAIVHPAEVAPALGSDCDMDVDLDEPTEELKEARRCLLHGILRQLVELGRLRSYAPPTLREVEYCRQIRKRITSSLAHIKAKAREFMKDRTAVAEVNLLCKTLECPLHTLSHYPKGHLVAAVLDTLPGCLSLIQEILPRMASLCSQFYADGWGEELSQDASRINLDHSSQVTEELEAQSCLTSETEKGKLTAVFHTSSPIENDNTAIHEKKTREECLVAMLQLFRRITSSFSSILLNAQEVKLFAQVVEHVTSSIWLFRTRRWDCLEKKAQDGKTGLAEKLLMAFSTGSRETRSREVDLEEIVVLVEAIRSSFLYVLPTKKEMRLYFALNRCMGDALAVAIPRQLVTGYKKRKKSSSTSEDSSCTPEDGSKERKVSSCTPEDGIYIENLVESIYSWELKWLQKLHEEYGKIIRMIIPSTSTGLHWAACWCEEDLCGKIMDEFEGPLSTSCQQKLKILDEMLLTLEQARSIADEAYRNIMDANYCLDFFVKEKRYGRVMEEVLSVSRVLQRSGSSYGCF